MDIIDDKSPIFITKLIIPTDDPQPQESERSDDNREENLDTTSRNSIISETSTESSILGRHFKLPDLSKSFDADPPTLETSLPYIPVYTHLITYDLTPIERPITPPMIKMLRSGRPMQSKNHLKSMSEMNPGTNKSDGQCQQAINYSARDVKFHKNNGTTQRDD